MGVAIFHRIIEREADIMVPHIGHDDELSGWAFMEEGEDVGVLDSKEDQLSFHELLDGAVPALPNRVLGVIDDARGIVHLIEGVHPFFVVGIEFRPRRNGAESGEFAVIPWEGSSRVRPTAPA